MNQLPTGGLALAALDEQILQPGVKGLPLTAPLRQGDIGSQGWNVLDGDTSFPVALLKISALTHNLDWMRRFCERHGAVLAPHGKTTMCPQLFGAQIANGAWGMTLACANQVQTAHRFGVRRVLLANQLVAQADIHAVLTLLAQDTGFELLVLADSPEGVARLSQAVQAHGQANGLESEQATRQPRKPQRPLPVLVELGIPGKRCGCRTPEQALALAHAVAAAPGLQLAGVAGYEGLLRDSAAVSAFVGALAALVRQADAAGLFGGTQIILSAGGSAWFDLVARGFAADPGQPPLSRPLLPVLRSGCYLTSDHGFYRKLIQDASQRESSLTQECPQQNNQEQSSPQQISLEQNSLEHDGLRPALEVWSTVLSRPEPTLALLGMGKRDASHDIDLPFPFASHRPNPAAPASRTPTALPPGCAIEKMNDQHAYLRIPADCGLAVGDLVGCGISHPCTTFDRWQLLLAVDDGYTVRFAVNTFF